MKRGEEIYRERVKGERITDSLREKAWQREMEIQLLERKRGERWGGEEERERERERESVCVCERKKDRAKKDNIKHNGG